MKIAVQVYSLRHYINDKDSLFNALEDIKAAGYDGVEFAGYFGAEAAELKAKLDELGLVAVGGHIGIENFESDRLADTIEFQHTLGVKAIGVGGAPHDTVEECVHTGTVLGNAQKYAMDKYGMKVYYHNHTEEFKKFDDGSMPIDIIGGLCSLEIDTYWSFVAGMDNYEFLMARKDNIVHLHIKDGIDGKPIVIGRGQCDIPTVVKAAKEMGMEWLIIENEDNDNDDAAAITESLNYLKSLI